MEHFDVFLERPHTHTTKDLFLYVYVGNVLCAYVEQLFFTMFVGRTSYI